MSKQRVAQIKQHKGLVYVSCFNVNWGLFATFSLQPGVYDGLITEDVTVCGPYCCNWSATEGGGQHHRLINRNKRLKSNETASLLKSDVICILCTLQSANFPSNEGGAIWILTHFFSFFSLSLSHSHSSSV